MSWAYLPVMVLPAGAGSFLLFLAAWELAGARGAGSPSAKEEGKPVGRSPAHAAIQLHLALWGFLALAAVSLFSADAALGLPGGSRRPLLLVAALPIGLALYVLGIRRARGRSYPAALRWALAPYNGLASWMVLLAATAQGLLGSGRPRRAADAPAGGASRSLPAADSILQGIADLDALTLDEVMIPRSQEVAVHAGWTLQEALSRVKDRAHGLYPVFEEGVDQPIGVVRMLDLVEPEAGSRRVRERVKPAPIVPETMRGLGLLRRLGGEPLPAALVVDEFGSHAGLVTVEDLVEVLVGDLVGEHEVERTLILPTEPGVYRVEGTCGIEEFNEQVAEVLPEGEYETVAGLILDRVGRIPQQGDDLNLPDADLEVLERTDRRIVSVRIALSDRVRRRASWGSRA